MVQETTVLFGLLESQQGCLKTRSFDPGVLSLRWAGLFLSLFLVEAYFAFIAERAIQLVLLGCDR